jgi:hypothetical protein
VNSSIPHLLVGWQSYYVIIGSSGAALTGLQFVVMALMAETTLPVGGGEAGVAAFASPTIVHFCAALLLSAMLSAPWPEGAAIAIGVAVLGAAGVLYMLNVLRRALGQNTTFLVAGLMMPANPVTALFVAAVAPAALLYIGIHNAWDAVTYAMLRQAKAKSEAANKTGASV